MWSEPLLGVAAPVDRRQRRFTLARRRNRRLAARGERHFMPHAERRVRSEFDQKMKSVLVGGTPAGKLVGCVYAVLDTDAEPLYVGRSMSADERLGTRIGRHVLAQRSDAANKVFPPFEARVLRVWPMRDPPGLVSALTSAETDLVKAAEKHVLWTLGCGTFPPFNESIPKVAQPVVALPAPVDIDFWPASAVAQLQDLDARVDRWTETMRRLAERIKHSGGSADLRRVQKLQAARLQHLLQQSP